MVQTAANGVASASFHPFYKDRHGPRVYASPGGCQWRSQCQTKREFQQPVIRYDRVHPLMEISRDVLFYTDTASLRGLRVYTGQTKKIRHIERVQLWTTLCPNGSTSPYFFFFRQEYQEPRQNHSPIYALGEVSTPDHVTSHSTVTR